MNPAGFPDYVLIGPGLYLPNPHIPINTGTPDEAGSYWWYETLKGWASPDSRVTMLPLVGQEGEIPADLHYRGRSVQMKGWVESPSETARERSHYLYTAALDALVVAQAGFFIAREVDATRTISFVHAGNSSTGLATFEDKGFPLRNAAEQVIYQHFRKVTDAVVVANSPTLTSATANFTSADIGAIVWDQLGYLPAGTAWIVAVNSPTSVTLATTANGSASGLTVGIGANGGLPNGLPAYYAEWEFELYSTDPRKYALAQSTATIAGGAATITSAGNTSTQQASISITTGGTSPFTVTMTTSVGNSTVLTLRAVAPNTMPATVIISPSARTVTDGSNNPRYDLVAPGSTWPAIFPGVNSLAISAALAGSVTWQDAWM